LATLFGHAHQWWDAYAEKNLVPTVKYFGESLMLLVCFASTDPWANVKVNHIIISTKYQDILAKNLVASARKLKLGHTGGSSSKTITPSTYQNPEINS
jgi:hypothetical protein